MGKIYIDWKHIEYNTSEYCHHKTNVIGSQTSIFSAQLSWSCWTLTIRNSRLVIFLKFGSKSPLTKPRDLSLSLGTGPWRFWSWIGDLVWMKMASRCLRTVIGKSSEQQQLDRELWGSLLLVMRVWRTRIDLCLAGVHSSIYFMYYHIYCWK